MAVNQLPVGVDEDGIPGVVRDGGGDGHARLVLHPLRPPTHRHAVQACVAVVGGVMWCDGVGCGVMGCGVMGCC